MASTRGQNLNLAGIGFFLGLLGGNRRRVLPHVSVPDIRWVNWKALHGAGYRGVVFDKDNTLTYPYALKTSLDECRDVFKGCVALYSNSSGLYQFDPEGKEAEAIEEALGIPVIRHHDKKPAGGAEDIEKHFGCKAEEIVMVGDRYLTDVAFGAKNSMLTVRCSPLTSEGEPLAVWLARTLEDNLVMSLKYLGTEPSDQALLMNPMDTEAFIKDPGIW